VLSIVPRSANVRKRLPHLDIGRTFVM